MRLKKSDFINVRNFVKELQNGELFSEYLLDNEEMFKKYFIKLKIKYHRQFLVFSSTTHNLFLDILIKDLNKTIKTYEKRKIHRF